MEHLARATVVGHGNPRTWAPKCRTCGWRGPNGTSRVMAEKLAARHNERAETKED